MIEWRLGTMGFGYSEWAEVFYPRGMKSVDYLSFYAKHFNAVELDTTFHAIPPAERVRQWRDATPDDFQFCAKTPKSITHDPDLPLYRSIPVMNEFLEVMRELGPKLGVVLLQFPPSFQVDQASAMEKFLEAMPRDLRFAAEFRHESWFVPRTAEMLRAHHCCWAAADYPGEPRQLAVTTDIMYIRWIGRHRQFPTMDRQRTDVTSELQVWTERLERHAAGASTVWGFFNNDYNGFAIAACEQFMRMVGLPVVPRQDPRQGDLFEDISPP
jgi:uncharacterized protein YecE (DUF72 family)